MAVIIRWVDYGDVEERKPEPTGYSDTEPPEGLIHIMDPITTEVDGAGDTNVTIRYQTSSHYCD